MPWSEALLASLLEDLAALDARLTGWQQTFSPPKDALGRSTPATPVDLSRLAHDLQGAFHQSTDLVLRPLGSPTTPQGLLVYLAGLVDRARVAAPATGLPPRTGEASGLVTQVAADWTAVLTGLVQGQVAWFAAAGGSPLLIDVSHEPHRGVSEPQTELTVRGSREAFAETVDTHVCGQNGDFLLTKHILWRQPGTRCSSVSMAPRASSTATGTR